MADVSVKMGVSGISQFKQGMTQAQASVKSLDAALKLNEKQFKATGDAENYMAQKTTLLQQKLEAQRKAAKNAEDALQTMRKNGVDEASAAYQNMQKKLLDARAAILDTEGDINQLGQKTEETAGKADKLGNSLSGLNKKVSLQQVQSAIGSITSGLEAGARKAAELGKELWDSIMESARRADDTATMAQMYGIDLQKFKQMQALVGGGLDTTVDAILTAQSKMKKGVGQGTAAVMEQLRALGLLQTIGGKDGNIEIIPKDADKLFWDAGQAILAMGDAYEQEAAAQALFGRSWKELIPLFSTYKSLEEYNKALEETSVSSEEATKNAATLSDRMGKLETTYTQLKDEIIGAVAEPLSKAAEALNGVLSSVLEYLQTPEGKQALEDMGKAVEGLFKNLGEIDPEQVVAGFSEVFNGIVTGVQWLSEHSVDVINAMKAIVGGWAALKLTGGALKIAELISGISGLGAGTAAATGAAAGASWGGAFASAVIAAAPWLAGLITLLAPAGSAGNDKDLMYDPKTGQITSAGWAALYNNPEGWGDSLSRVGEIFGDLGRILGDVNAMTEVAKWATGNGDEAGMIKALEALGYVKVQPEPEPEYKTAGHADIGPAETGEQREHRPQAKRPWEQEEVEVEPELPDNAQEILQGALNQMTLQVAVRFNPIMPGGFPMGSIPGRANGLPLVPFDNFPALLHKGERIVPAREVNNSRNFSSNLYVESMYMNNGQDADGLAAAMAAAQRRTMSGYGS